MKKQSKDTAPEIKKTTIGGQALIEGLLMIGPEKKAMANLLPNGEIILRDLGANEIPKSINVPLLRGAVRVFKQLSSGTKALMLSADIQEEFDNPEGKKKKSSALLPVLALVLGLGMGIALFMLLPNLLTTGLIALTGVERQGFSATLIYNLIEGFIRIFILLFYMWLSSKQQDIKRVWMFHGAEHKTIACYEAGMDLTVENIRPFSRFHPRCGTSFIFIMIFISAIVFAIVGWYGLWLNLLIRLALIPLVAGLAYEILRFSGKHSDRWIGRVLAKPGLLLQRLTTKEPDDTMLAVAISAMNAVIPEDSAADNWG